MTRKPRVSIITPVRATSKGHVAWLCEAIESVKAQECKDWEMVIIDDHSTANMEPVKRHFKDVRLIGYRNKGKGVASARNHAASKARGELILPLDADDLLPRNAVGAFLGAWEKKPKGTGIVYGDTLIFGDDYQRYFKSSAYDFSSLLHHLLMPVGSLHRKADWQRIGGWKAAMNIGLEDWEYWITLGEHGVCGFYVPVLLYQYRRNFQGRLASIKKEPSRYQQAYTRMRDLHKQTYNGRYPMGCCGKHRRTPTGPRPGLGVQPQSSLQIKHPVMVVYTGARRGAFGVRGATGTRYRVHGPQKLVTQSDGTPGVHPKDVQTFLRMNRGQDFMKEE